MTSMLHALNTGTLAAWLSVAGFGTVGVLVPDWQWMPADKAADEVVTEYLPPEIDLGEGSPEIPAAATETPDSPAPEPLPETPEIPAMPEIADLAPLPEIPDLPEPAVEKPAAKNEWATHPKPIPPKSKPTGQTPRQNPKSTGSGDSGATAGGSAGLSNGARLAAGRMPAPSYPAAARRAGQTGTVTIAFTVDTSGKVISAHAVNPSPWPLLNEEAVRTVRRWKFPPGGVMKLQRPIVFQLR